MSPLPPLSQVACTVRPWAQFPLDRALRGIRAAGFDAVALPVHGVTEVITPDTPAAAAAEVGDQIAGHGLTLSVLSHSAALDRSDAEALAALRRQIEHCARLGVPVLVDMSCTEPAAYERYLRLMRAGAPHAAEHGVTIAVKPHGGLTRTAADLLAVVHRVDHEAYRICWDPGNLVHYGGEPSARGLAEVAPWIVAVGARDHPGRGVGRGATTGAMPPAITPGDGIVDFTGLYRTLREHGFAGPSAVESVTRLGTVEALDSEAARAREVLCAAAEGRPAPQRPASRFARRSCSRIARAGDEELVGTARYFDRFLLVELPLPWPPGMGTPVWETERVPEPLRAALRAATRRTQDLGYEMKTMALAPDEEYSRPGHTRVLRFDRPPGPTAGLTRSEYHVPDGDAPALIDALFAPGPAPLERFAGARVDEVVRDLIVCTHASVDACCGTFGYPLYRQLRARHGSGGPVRVWRVSSFGGHRFAPSVIDLPEGRYWGNVSVERMDALVDRTGPVEDVLDMYRGWGCLRHRPEQVLEKELFRREGWSWVGRRFDLDTLDVDGPRIRFRATAQGLDGSERYEAVVAHTGTLPVLIGCDGTAGQVERYALEVLERAGRRVTV
ncbi:TIM barrel protein (plasmid) [Pseudonocardia bannensis]|uniref:TIM barrel protein n=1 Tax=Pseudonocardia bannensis TaxID=630973 RepID=A0A848DP43_9PSEU|nr:TIM barrel protein [Pseudonocardia bannensis]NMH94542.1 TIM barrel protein [Pseudonocardia bannensis]